MTMPSPVLKVVGLGFSTVDKQRLFSDLSFELKRGQIISVVGPSGIGKSTLLKLLSGALKPENGSIVIEGVEADSIPSSIAIVQQEYTLFPHLNSRRNIELILRRKEPFLERIRRNPEIDRKVEKILDQVNMVEHGEKFPSQLSGGQRQRIAIAQTLAQNASFLLMDEPFGALDEETRLQLQELIVSPEIRDKLGILVVTHDLEEALLISNQVLILGPDAGDKIKIQDIVGLSQNETEMRNSDAFFKTLTLLRDLVFQPEMSEPDTVLIRNVISESDMMVIEEMAEKIVVISKELFQEQSNQNIQVVVSENISKGKAYIYVVPNTADGAIEWVNQQNLTNRAKLELALEDPDHWLFQFGEIVLYQLKNGTQLGYTYSGGVLRGTLFRIPDSLAKFLFSQYCAV